jgi:hypothetical protein
MASKKKLNKKRPAKRRDAKAVLKVSRRAQAEVAELLKRNQSGTITRVDLETGLEEVEERLKVMILFMCKFL